MNRSLIMSIALVSLIAMGSPAMADGIGVRDQGNSAAGTKSVSESAQPSCRGDRASLFVIANEGFDPETKFHDALLTDLIARFFDAGAMGDC